MLKYETPGNVSIISEQKKHPATCKFILKLTKNFFNYYLHLLILNQITAATPKPRRSRPVECCILSISSTQAVGHTFHFLDVPGSKLSPQYIFLIHPQEITIYRNILHIILSSIPNNSTNTSPTGS